MNTNSNFCTLIPSVFLFISLEGGLVFLFYSRPSEISATLTGILLVAAKAPATQRARDVHMEQEICVATDMKNERFTTSYAIKNKLATLDGKVVLDE